MNTDIVRFANQILKSDKLVIWDTETTGLTNHDQVIELAAINANGDTLFNQRFLPTVQIHPAAQKAHGLSLDVLSNCKTIDHHRDEILNLLVGKTWVTYNLSFDCRLIMQSLPSPRWDEFRSACAMHLYADFAGEWDDYKESNRWFKLTEACAREGITVTDAHSALGDAKMTLALLQKLASYYKD